MNYRDKDFISGKEFRELMGISTATLNRWIKSGKITVSRMGPRAPVRIRVEEVDRLIKETEYTPPKQSK